MDTDDDVGSVIQVVRDDGAVVSQYDYDAFGNLIEANSFETVENRYRFRGRIQAGAFLVRAISCGITMQAVIPVIGGGAARRRGRVRAGGFLFWLAAWYSFCGGCASAGSGGRHPAKWWPARRRWL
ncbi:MAG: hypothetical protein ACOC8E_06870 [Planctomycetota bacterium]